nr:hypothetical protein [Tanacetum cinerariifolium]
NFLVPLHRKDVGIGCGRAHSARIQGVVVEGHQLLRGVVGKLPAAGVGGGVALEVVGTSYPATVEEWASGVEQHSALEGQSTAPLLHRALQARGHGIAGTSRQKVAGVGAEAVEAAGQVAVNVVEVSAGQEGILVKIVPQQLFPNQVARLGFRVFLASGSS